MKCTNCGYENQQYFEFCPNCGAVSQDDVVSLNPAADKILPFLKDTLFLIICILSSVISLLSLKNGGIPVISILFTVFLWLTYAQAHKDCVNSNHLRSLSGTFFANYVIVYVIFGLVFLAGILFAIIFTAVADTTLISEALESFDLSADEYSGIFETVLSVSGWLIMFVCTLVSAIGILINFFGMRKIHKLAQSVYRSAENCELDLKCVKPAKIWLYVFGILQAVYALTLISADTYLDFTKAVCTAATLILTAILINKHFS